MSGAVVRIEQTFLNALKQEGMDRREPSVSEVSAALPDATRMNSSLAVREHVRGCNLKYLIQLMKMVGERPFMKESEVADGMDIMNVFIYVLVLLEDASGNMWLIPT